MKVATAGTCGLAFAMASGALKGAASGAASGARMQVPDTITGTSVLSSKLRGNI